MAPKIMLFRKNWYRQVWWHNDEFLGQVMLARTTALQPLIPGISTSTQWHLVVALDIWIPGAIRCMGHKQTIIL
jgi:hypothetical protein